jgi:hypothetical protein
LPWKSHEILHFVIFKYGKVIKRHARGHRWPNGAQKKRDDAGNEIGQRRDDATGNDLPPENWAI